MLADFSLRSLSLMVQVHLATESVGQRWHSAVKIRRFLAQQIHSVFQ
jgi:hypothetical protein